MFPTFTPDQKAAIVVQVMKEESAGRSLRECCREQGITVQTFLDWRQSARRHNQFDTLHAHNGPRSHPERERQRRERPKTALELAFESARVHSYPGHDEPAAFKASTGFDLPAPLAESAPETPAAVLEASPLPAPVQPDSAPENAPQPANEEPPMPKRKCPDYSQGARGIAKAMYAACPFLHEYDQLTFEQLGERPDKTTDQPAYNRWVAHRKTLMTPAQVQQLEGFFGGSRKGKTAVRRPGPKQRVEQAEIAAARAGAPINGLIKDAINELPAPSVPELVEQHAELSAEIASHEETGLTIHVKAPRNVAALVSENDRLKRALTALTLENLQLRGVL